MVRRQWPVLFSNVCNDRLTFFPTVTTTRNSGSFSPAVQRKELFVSHKLSAKKKKNFFFFSIKFWVFFAQKKTRLLTGQLWQVVAGRQLIPAVFYFPGHISLANFLDQNNSRLCVLGERWFLAGNHWRFSKNHQDVSVGGPLTALQVGGVVVSHHHPVQNLALTVFVFSG